MAELLVYTASCVPAPGRHKNFAEMEHGIGPAEGRQAAIGLIAHSAYHLGAIRQIVKSVKQ